MDIYDPQTLGIVVFSGFMVISAIGIALVSTFSMKETSYEEALANQRRELGRTQPQRSEKKKKEKPSEKRSRAKKKEEKLNGKLPESERIPEAGETVSDSEPEPLIAPETAPLVQEPPVVMAAAPVISAPAPVSAPVPTPPPAPCPVAVEVPSAPSPKDKKKKEKKVAKVEPASTQAAPAPVPKPNPVLEVVTKEVPIMAVPPVGPRASAPALTAAAPVPTKAEEPKPEAPPRKKGGSKKKSEPAAADSSVDAPLYLPYKTLVSTFSSMVFSEGEAQRLIEILSEKAGIVQDTWHTATQKGDPVTVLKKQLEEKEKQLAAEQEDTAAAKSRLRELTKELSAEKSKLASVETRLSSQLSSREQEMKALQARMQASYQDHLAETQQLNTKIQSLQEQLEKGPNAQLARLQQENSILRDALNQATSQSESKQNAELAKLRQECAKLTKEVGDKSDALLADEQHRKSLEAKVSAAEKQLAQVQASQVESTRALQQRLEEVSEELRRAQSFSSGLQSELDKARQELSALAEVQVRATGAEAELKDCHSQSESLRAQLALREEELTRLQERIVSIEALLEAGQSKQAQEAELSKAAEVEELQNSVKNKEQLVASLEQELKRVKLEMEEVKTTEQRHATELEHLHRCLKDKEGQVHALDEELKQLNGEMERVKNVNVQQNNTAELEQLQNSLRERDTQVTLLEREMQKMKDEVDEARSKVMQTDHTAQLEQLQTSLKDREGQIAVLETQFQQLKDGMEQVMAERSDVELQLNTFQAETRTALQTLFPHISVETDQAHWLPKFTQKAQETLQMQQQEARERTPSLELLEKLREAEEGRSTLQAECDQYRTVLGETEGMLKHLQKSVEEEELVWKAKMIESEEQLKKALDQIRTLELTVEQMKTENQSAEQLRGQVMLLEAQLEKQLEMASSLSQNYEDVTQLKLLLSETQGQLEMSQSEAQKLREELALAGQRLSKMTEQTRDVGELRGSQNGQLGPGQVFSQLQQVEQTVETEKALRRELLEEFEQAQKCVTDLQTQLDLLKAAGEGPTPDMEDVSQLKERLEKEKKLSKDLGQAATKLQQLLKATQDQLVKEKGTVRRLQEQLQEKGETEELKEGTSV